MAEIEQIDSQYYNKIFNLPNKLINIRIPEHIDLKKFNEKLKKELDENGHLLLYHINDNYAVPIRILDGVLTTYDKYANDARTFIKNELLEQHPSEVIVNDEDDDEKIIHF